MAGLPAEHTLERSIDSPAFWYWACCLSATAFPLLGTAIEGAGKLEGALTLTQMPGVNLAEAGLIFLLVVHFFGGLRLLAIENLRWFGGQKLIAISLAMVSGSIAFIFLLIHVL